MQKQLVLQMSAALKFAPLSIKPFFSSRRNMGLENWNMVVHSGIVHTDQVICKVDGKTKTYITGLNEKSRDMQDLAIEAQHDEAAKEKYEARIIAIRRLVARAERELAGNYTINPEATEIEKDATFWEKVKTFRSVVPDVFDNNGIRQPTYWDELTIKMNNEGIILSGDNVKDLLIISVIEAGGFCMIADSYETAAMSQYEYKFYLDKKQDTSATKSVDRKIRDKAGAKLLDIRENDSNKLFYITKLISNDSLFFKDGRNATPLDTMYEEIANYLDGKGTEVSKHKACKEFLSYAGTKLEDLKVRAVLIDAITMRLVVLNDSTYMHLKSGTMIGNSIEESVMYLKNPGNAKAVYNTLLSQVQEQWTK